MTTAEDAPTDGCNLSLTQHDIEITNGGYAIAECPRGGGLGVFPNRRAARAAIAAHRAKGTTP
jgi:hypothetical protein